MRKSMRSYVLPAAFIMSYIAVASGMASAGKVGPSTTAEPYVLPSIPGVETISILTVGDAINGYRLVGIPDGLGAFRTLGGDFTLLMNHELGPEQGAARAHGSRGAFVSRWTIKRDTLEVVKGEDQTPSPSHVYSWNPSTGQYVQGTVAWNRFCSGDLSPLGAFLYEGMGTLGRLYLKGEETRPPFSPDHGAAWAHIATGPSNGQTWQLPRLGRMSFENVVANPHSQLKTVVILLDDAAASTSPTPPNVPSELYVYVGTKTNQGNPVERAGLTNGQLYGMKVSLNDGTPVVEESNAFGLNPNPVGPYVGSGRFSLHDLGDVSGLTGNQLQAASIAAGIFRMQRVEDGAWDPRPTHRDDFYFVTTASFSTNSRLWHLRFDDITQPERGGTVEILLKGDEGHKMLDNMAMDWLGRILIQEDVGNNPRLGKIWLYHTLTGELVEVAAHNPEFFTSGMPKFLTADEESSGIIDASRILGAGWFLLDVQVHFASADLELVEGGQLLAMFVDPRIGFGPHGGGAGAEEEEEDIE